MVVAPATGVLKQVPGAITPLNWRRRVVQRAAADIQQRSVARQLLVCLEWGRFLLRREVGAKPVFFGCLTLLYLSQEQPGLGRTKRLASQHRQLPPKQGHNQRRRMTAVGKPPSSDHLANPFEERAACLWRSRCHHRIFR